MYIGIVWCTPHYVTRFINIKIVTLSALNSIFDEYLIYIYIYVCRLVCVSVCMYVWMRVVEELINDSSHVF